MSEITFDNVVFLRSYVAIGFDLNCPVFTMLRSGVGHSPTLYMVFVPLNAIVSARPPVKISVYGVFHSFFVYSEYLLPYSLPSFQFDFRHMQDWKEG